MKKYVLFAGVNGAGKTTLYQTNIGLETLPRVNVDEIVREFGSWNNLTDITVAGRKAVELINGFFDNGVSFNQETTLCGKSILRNIRKAKKELSRAIWKDSDKNLIKIFIGNGLYMLLISLRINNIH